MTQSTKSISLPGSEQSAEAATTEPANKSVSIPGGGGKASVPSIIHELYGAPTLYPGEDPALCERLLEELAHTLAPADLIQWLLVADLRAVILDERRYRKILDMIMSPKETNGATVYNFQNYSSEVEKLDYLIERCRKTKTGILSRLDAMKTVSSSLHRATEIKDVEFTEAAE
jgi:hypothetical protein